MLVMSHCKRKKKMNFLSSNIKFKPDLFLFYIEEIIRRFKKLSFDTKFDFDLIFLTTNDAVYYINGLRLKQDNPIIFDQFSQI